ncbi:hypothetical protein Tco_1550790, partial [Tanacetum coccineum]
AEERRQGTRDVGYGIRDTWVDPAGIVHEIAPMTVGEVNTRVTELADLYALLEDAQDRDSIDYGGGGICFPRGLGSLDTIKSGDPSGASDPSQIMAPTTRRGQNTPTSNTNPNNMTPESVQAIIDQALQRNSIIGDTSHRLHRDDQRNVQTARPCYYADFMKCQPLNFKGTEGVVGLTRWIEKMESVFNISGCAIENQVKFTTCTLLGDVLTWWNSQIRTLGPEA